MAEHNPRVIVVGGGAAGLAAAASLVHRGIEVAVIEREDEIGASWRKRYERLRLHTVRRFSGLPYHPIPSDLPRYLSKDEYAAYLRDYASVLGLPISGSENVERVALRQPANPSEGLEVCTSRRMLLPRVVVIATGHYAVPRIPDWPGRDGFAGAFVHSSAYVTGAKHVGRRAVVVGMGNSGAEIAADLAEQGAASVSISVRSTPPIVTRELLGAVPVQLLGIALTPLRIPGIVDRVGSALRRISVGDLAEFGLGGASWGPFTARRPAVIDAGFLDQLRGGRIVVRPETEGFDGPDVVYADGSRETADVVVAATGFGTGLTSYLDVPGVVDDAGQPLTPSGRPTSVPGLFFVGYDETVRGHLFEASHEAPRLAKEIDRYLAEG